jgi:hypothetical protein
MSWRTTSLLVLLAAALFAFIYFVERHSKPTGLRGQPPGRLLQFTPAEVTSLHLRRTNQFVLEVGRANGSWNLTAPLFYPAQAVAIENLLRALAGLTNHVAILPDEMAAHRKTVADFGLDVPAATLTLRQGQRRTEILFGAKTPPGDQVYVQLLNAPGVHVIPAVFFDSLPKGPNDWRDTALLNLTGLNPDRMEVRLAGRGYAVNVDPTNKVFVLSKPTPARADNPKVQALLRRTQTARVTQFVSDDPRAELEAYGLQPPEAELIYGLGTNDLVVVQFGRSPTNDPAQVYARRLAQTNIVLVPRSLLEALQVSPAELRDRHLFTFAPEAVDTLEVRGPEGFAVRRQASGAWIVIEPQATLLDPELIRELLHLLGRLEGRVEKDVVTDFAAYGLAPPARQYLLLATVTNATGSVTNRLLAQLDAGVRQGDKVFVRRGDEPNTVYSVTPAEFDLLPGASWQLRDRRVWTFAPNQVKRVTVRHNGYTRQLMRNPAGDWVLAPGSQGIIKNTLALEETMHRLSELRAVVWTARGEEARNRYGFVEDGFRITLELAGGDSPSSVSVEFGNPAPSLHRYALTQREGQTWIFEFPLPLYFDVLRDLGNPPLRSPSGTL